MSEIEADYFTEHSPIEIDSNQDFEAVSSTGTGSAEDPYVIEKLHIIATGTQNSSISVEYTSMHFIIRDCYFQTDWAGIEIRHIADGTGVLANNTCVSNSGGGAGIVVWGTQNCTITGNRCSNLAQGIHLNEAGRCCITSNNVSDNSYQGINIRYSYSNTITGNRIMDSSEHGVALVGTSRDNLIYGNYFVDNGKEATYRIDGEPRGELTSQGFDEGSNNTWYDAELEAGNWWSDYTGSGSYNIDGPSNSVDLYP
ncbi:MAG: NosD domain-containing protein, partial [Candidatus Hodarchaeota archaeon]